MKSLYFLIIILVSFLTTSALADVPVTNSSITISAQHGALTYDKCGDIKEDFVIKGTIGMPQNNSPVQILIYYPNGTLYDSTKIPLQDISSTGSYRYWFSLMLDDKTTFGPYNVTVSHNGQSAHTSVHLVMPPGPIRTITGDFDITDMNGQRLSGIRTGQQIQIQDVFQPICGISKFVYLLQIVDKNQMTVSLSWLEGSDQSLPLNISNTWTTFYPGNYTINRFVWQNLTNPNALLPSLSKTIEVR